MLVIGPYMMRYILVVLLLLLVINNKPVYSSDFSLKNIENYTLKISKKFSRTYCNTFNFGISENGALSFATNETIKEFLDNDLNKFIDYKLLKKDIILSLEKYCNVSNFDEDKLANLAIN